MSGRHGGSQLPLRGQDYLASFAALMRLDATTNEQGRAARAAGDMAQVLDRDERKG